MDGSPRGDMIGTWYRRESPRGCLDLQNALSSEEERT